MTQRSVKIGGASGFWGDSMTGLLQLVQVPGIQYITFDYLAELTMSLLAKAKSKDPSLGYAPDFVQVAMKFNLATLREKGIKIISNAGGINPQACAAALAQLATDLGVEVNIAVVDGDDVTECLPAMREQGTTDFYSGKPMPKQFVSANAYLGAFPIAQALQMGADIVITGRTVDSALPLGALIHEFGWGREDFDYLAAGSLAGHIIECGCQATGGLHTDWRDVPDWASIGYPIIDVRADGSFTLTKPEGTGGLINRAVVSEQMLYEIGNPASYMLPDVICDFTQVHIEADASQPHCVHVSGAKGRAPTPQYKVSATYVDGYRCIANLTIVGFEAADKARRTGDAIIERTRGLFNRLGLPDYSAVRLDVMGLEADYGPHAQQHPLREAVLRMAVSHPVKMALEIFAREIAPAGTSFAPGTTGQLSSGRPSVSPQVKLFTFLIDKTAVTPRVRCGDLTVEVPDPVLSPSTEPDSAQPLVMPVMPTSNAQGSTVPLIQIAYARSGDKGDISNVGVIARKPEWLDIIRTQVTPERVKAYLQHLVKGDVTVFDVPGIGAINVVMTAALDGGGMSSMRNDPLGKGMGQILLSMPVCLSSPDTV